MKRKNGENQYLLYVFCQILWQELLNRVFWLKKWQTLERVTREHVYSQSDSVDNYADHSPLQTVSMIQPQIILTVSLPD